MERKLDNWLKALAQYVEETEAPREYWTWGGIFTINSALQRKVWIPYGLENIYPNMYLLIVDPPGERKALPPTIAKRMLTQIGIPVAVDSSSKRSLTEELAATVETEKFVHNGDMVSMANLTVISKEMSSLLALDPKAIIEVLTDLYDSHDIWKYKTSKQGEDFLYNVCVNCFIVTTPSWFMNNLPEEAIGGGFTSRQLIVSGGTIYKPVPWPPLPSEALYAQLISDLMRIKALTGEFKIDPEAREIFETWYRTIDGKKRKNKDERVHGYYNRMHVSALKISMGIHAAYSNELIITPDDIGQAILMVEDCAKMASIALGGHGRSKLGPDTDIVLRQIRTLRRTTLRELLAANFRNVGKTELKEILETLKTMGSINMSWDNELKDLIIDYRKGDENE